MRERENIWTLPYAMLKYGNYKGVMVTCFTLKWNNDVTFQTSLKYINMHPIKKN